MNYRLAQRIPPDERELRWCVIDESNNIRFHSESYVQMDKLCRRLNNLAGARLKEQRRLELVRGDQSVEKTLDASALRAVTRGESYRVGDEG